MRNIHARRFLPILILGFSSGLPLALTSSTLQAWLTKSGLSIVTISWFSLVGQPYVYKFLWAPLIDRFNFPFLDRRRSWILFMQGLLILFLCCMAMINPSQHIGMMGLFAFLVALSSSTQDTAYDAYRTDLLTAEERGLGSTMMVLGYRIAIIVSGAFALFFAQYHGWRDTYFLMALIMLVGVVGNVIAEKLKGDIKPPPTVHEAYLGPIKEFFSRSHAWKILLLIFLYKLGDAFTLSLSTTFLLRGLHFTLVDLAVINKVGSLLATIVGGLLGGFLMMRMRLFPALLWFGVFQAVTNLLYMLLAIVGKSYSMMATAVIFEHLASGMGTVAFLALLMALCDHRFSATQFALFSCVASLGRVYIGPIAGVMVEHMGWVEFYFWTFIAAAPSLIVLWWLKNKIHFNSPDVVR
ncbi:MAG: muropeptide transporter AmpG [Legionellaceae bacterium]|nr:muropeptide transporter AmpG [Legionellaceae bacterium]